MITINKDRTAYIPESDRHIGFENDNLVETRYFDIVDEEIADFSFKLDLADTLDIVDLEKVTLDDGKCVLMWKITSSMLGEGGIIKAQLRAFDQSGERVWHSHMLEFVADESVNGEKQIDDERILSEFEQLEARATSAVNDAQSYANNAKDSASVAKEYSDSAQATENSISAKITSFENSYANASEQAAKAEQHYADKNNPHQVSASQVGAYNKEESDGIFATKTELASEKEELSCAICDAKELVNPLMQVDEFAWTDLEYFTDGTGVMFAQVTENEFIIDGADPGDSLYIIAIGNTLGFTFSIAGYSDARMRINGKNMFYPNEKKDGSVFATDTIPLSYMNADIRIFGDGNTWTFSDMKRGTSPLVDTRIGDINTALDSIIDIQNELIG